MQPKAKDQFRVLTLKTFFDAYPFGTMITSQAFTCLVALNQSCFLCNKCQDIFVFKSVFFCSQLSVTLLIGLAPVSTTICGPHLSPRCLFNQKMTPPHPLSQLPNPNLDPSIRPLIWPVLNLTKINTVIDQEGDF